MESWEVVYQYTPAPIAVIRPVKHSAEASFAQKIGFIILAIALGGFIGPFIPAARLEAFYWTKTATTKAIDVVKPESPPLPPSAPIVFTPLIAPDGASITPVNKTFSIIIPKIGVNAPVIANVDPTSPATYDSALLAGVAHSQTSYLPDENGTTYLFSHSTNYDWFVKDLNAVFYLLKNLSVGDYVVLYYKDKLYTYQIKEIKIVNSKDISYLVPVAGQKRLILETCWPPGTVNKRLLVFADLMK